MKKLNNLKGKVKETAVEVKDWASENKGLIISCGALAVSIIGCVAITRYDSKKCAKAWRAAKEAYENGNLDHDFGPYKVMKIFEPTGQFIGETVCHEKTTNAFLELK